MSIIVYRSPHLAVRRVVYGGVAACGSSSLPETAAGSDPGN